MRKIALVSTLALAAAAVASPAQADVITLNFEGIAPHGSETGVQILDYYNGGTSSNATTGTNYGVSFGSNAVVLCLDTPGVNCSNTSRGGFGDPNSQNAGLFFLNGSETFLNFDAGFDTGFAFNYASNNTPGSVSVYDGLNGTGNLLATIALPVNAPGCTVDDFAAYCPFGPAGVAFAGVAKSISFGGVANFIVFDDITFGSATPGGGGQVPEPATWAMMLLGFGAAGAALRRKRREEAALAVG